MEADLILAGGRVYALGRSGLAPCSHLAVAGGRVLALGGEEVMGLRGRRTRVLDLRGGAVLPGFNDAHAHVVYYGLTSFGPNLEGARSLAEIQRRLARAAARLAPGQWLVGRGYSRFELAGGRPPTRWELDAVLGDRPAYIDERGGHSRVASSAALAAAGIDAATPDPPGGELGREADGTPNGRLRESAMRLVADHQPRPDFERRQRGILRCQRLLLSRGVTSVGAAVNRGFADDLRAYQKLWAGRRLRLRVNAFLSWELLPAASSLGLAAGFGGEGVRAGPIKVFVDGGAGAGAVALRGAGGPWRTTPAELAELVGRASSAGLQVAAHAIGDAAIEAMCDAVELAGPAARRLRHRVEHCLVCPPDLQARLARLGMVAVMQPLFWSVPRAAVQTAFAPELVEHLAPHADLIRAGVAVAFSSDLPVTPEPSPWLGLAAAVGRHRQRLSRLSALRAYTWGGAYTSFEEAAKGSLRPGALADLQVYAKDPLGLATEEWPRLRPLLVLVGGRPAWGSAAQLS